MKNRKILFAFLGFFLGNISFLIDFLSNRFLGRPSNLFWLTPSIFAVFGYFVGANAEKLVKQNELVEKLSITLREQALTDELTGFHNRRQILIEVQREIDRARRYNRNLSGIMVGIGDFKSINEKFGQNYGDYILKEIAKTIHHCIRSTDVFGRYGGDEFIVVMPEADAKSGEIVAARIRSEIARHRFETKGEAVKINVNVGIHFFDNIKEVDKMSFIETLEKAYSITKSQSKNKPAQA